MTKRLYKTLFLFVSIILLIDRIRVLIFFNFKFTDDDQVIFWIAAKEFLALKFREPSFYGQAYNSLFESLLSTILIIFSIPCHLALPIVTALISLTPWFLLSIIATVKRNYLLSLLVLSVPVVLPHEYSMITLMPRGYTVGIFFVTLGIFLYYLLPNISLSFFLIGLLSSIGFVFNQNSIILSLPALLYIWMNDLSDKKFLIFCGTGLLIGIMMHLLVQYFYFLYPSYNLHPMWPLYFDYNLMIRGLKSIDLHLGYLVPVNTDPMTTILVLFVGVVWISIKFKNWRYLAVSCFNLIFLFSTFGIPKVHDGTLSVFFPFARMYLAAPLMMCFSAIELFDSSSHKFSRYIIRTSLMISLSMVLFVFAYKQFNLIDTVKQMEKIRNTPVAFQRVEYIFEHCDLIKSLGRKYDADLIVYSNSRIRAYGCGALLYGEIDTLFPEYERRTWRLIEESTNTRSSILFAGTKEDFCEKYEEKFNSCITVSEEPFIVHVNFDNQPTINIIREVDLKVRKF
ncbi:MAG: hypothetical protein AB4372_33120 [Xenococcus sp. (in: cyanobacteria)]